MGIGGDQGVSGAGDPDVLCDRSGRETCGSGASGGDAIGRRGERGVGAGEEITGVPFGFYTLKPLHAERGAASVDGGVAAFNKGNDCFGRSILPSQFVFSSWAGIRRVQAILFALRIDQREQIATGVNGANGVLCILR